MERWGSETPVTEIDCLSLISEPSINNGTACCVDLPSIIQYGSIYWRQALLWLHIFEAIAMLVVESSVPSKSLVNQEHRLESAFQIIHVHLSAF